VRARGKLGSTWDGPYPIIQVKNPQLFLVRRRKWNKLMTDTVRAGQIRKFTFRDDMSAVDNDYFQTPAGLELRESEIPGAGWGVFSNRAFLYNGPQDEVDLGFYEGENTDEAEFKRRYDGEEAAYVIECEEATGRKYVEHVAD
jgi:hypothetical protein